MKYTLVIRILHWLMAFIILCMIAVGYYMTGLSRDNPLRGELFSLHKSFGITILLLVVLRLGLRLTSSLPPLPATIPSLEVLLAKLGHYSLYALMFAIPMSGYLLTNSFGLSVKWFGIELPRLFSVDKATGSLAADFHGIAAYTLLGLIVIHVAAVVKHWVKDRVNLLPRMF